MVKSKSKKDKEEPQESSGMSLDDAFDGDEDVEYAQSKPKPIKKSKKEEEDEEEDFEEEEVSVSSGEEVITEVVGSKPISKIKKGDIIDVDTKKLEVDSHYILIEHDSTNEMAIELFDPKTDKDYQIRYFSDQVETSLEVYELKEILYSKLDVKRVSW